MNKNNTYNELVKAYIGSVDTEKIEETIERDFPDISSLISKKKKIKIIERVLLEKEEKSTYEKFDKECYRDAKNVQSLLELIKEDVRTSSFLSQIRDRNLLKYQFDNIADKLSASISVPVAKDSVFNRESEEIGLKKDKSSVLENKDAIAVKYVSNSDSKSETILISFPLFGFKKEEVSIQYFKAEKTLSVIAAKKNQEDLSWPYAEIADQRKNIKISSISSVSGIECKLEDGILAIKIIGKTE